MKRHLPPSLAWFERIYVLSFALTIVQMATVERFDPAMADVSAEVLFAVYAIALVFVAAIWFMVVQRASKAWRWVYVCLVVLGVVLGMTEFAALIRKSWIAIGMEASGQLAGIATVWLLFTPEARRWFAQGGSKGAIDPAVFN